MHHALPVPLLFILFFFSIPIFSLSSSIYTVLISSNRTYNQFILHKNPSLAMAGGTPTDAAAVHRANRRRKMTATKRSKSVSRQPAAAASGRVDPHPGNAHNSNVAAQGPARTLDGLRYLVKKELKNSDVGRLGRIVLPKKESENNLPWLKPKEDIVMDMVDYTNSQTWRFKYRYWINNRSRMYVLENTGAYVESHGLQTGDFIILYKDDKNDRYVIRAKKAGSTEEEAPVAPVPRDEGIFDFVLPELAVDEVFQPLPNDLLGMNYDYGQSYDFMQDFPPDPFLDDTTAHAGSTSFNEQTDPLFGWKP